MMDISDQLARLERANNEGAQLGAAIQAWAARQPWGGEAEIADDRLSWQLRLTVSEQPPIEEWGLDFGVAVHHLRALLDNLVVVIAKASGVNDPAELNRLSFPIAGSTEEWRKSRSRIAALPNAYRDAIERLQPFHRYEEGGIPDQDLLLLLRDLDNQDKHHLQVKPAIEKSQLEHEFAVEFASETDAAASVPPQVEVFDAPFEDGALLLRQTTKGRIATVKGAHSVAAQVRVALPDGSQGGVTQTLAMLCYYVGAVLNYLARLEQGS